MLTFTLSESFFRLDVLSMWAGYLLQSLLFSTVCVVIGYGFLGLVDGVKSTSKTLIWFLTGLGVIIAMVSALYLLQLATIPIVLAVSGAAVAGSLFARGVRNPLKLAGDCCRNWWPFVPVFVLSSFSALLPAYRFDEMSFHAAYPFQWNQAGGITIDPSMQYPYFTFNLHALFGLALMLGDGLTVHFVVWLIGCVGALLVLAFLVENGVHPLLGWLGAFAYYLSPVIQRYLNVGYLDVPLNVFVLGNAFLFFLCLRQQGQPQFGWALAVSCGLLLGTKVTQAPFVLCILCFVVYFHRIHRSYGQSLAFLLLVFLTGGFWYLRNLILSGDPLWPLLSAGIGKVENIWSVEDLAVARETMKQGLDSLGVKVLALPWLMTRPDALKDYPANFFVLLLPFTALFLKRFFREHLWASFGVLCVQAVLWVGVAPLIRNCYILGVGSAFATLILWYAYQRVPKPSRVPAHLWQGALLLMAAALLFGPSKQWISYATHNYNRKIPVSPQEVAQFVGYGDPSVPDFIGKTLPEVFRSQGVRNVYAFGLTSFRLYFQYAGFEITGNDFGPYRFRDFVKIKNREALQCWIKRAGIEGFAIDKKTLNRVAAMGGGTGDAVLTVLGNSGIVREVYSNPGLAAFVVERQAGVP